jgi:hypothetical protein
MDLIQAGGRTGYNVPVGMLDDVMRASQAGREMPGGIDWEGIKPREFTTQGGVPGVYGKGGQFQLLSNGPGGAQRVPMADAPKIEGYDLLPTDQGGWRYQRKASEKASVDLSQFDANGDGKLTGDEVAKAIMAASMTKTGLPYEGMTITTKPGSAATPAKPDGSLFDRFKTWRSGK